MPTLIQSPSVVNAAGNKPKIIEEFIGRVNSKESNISIAHMKSPGGWVEPGQTPKFTEYTIVLLGLVRVKSKKGFVDVKSGEAIVARKGEWVQYSMRESECAECIAVCIPAFSPSTVHRAKRG